MFDSEGSTIGIRLRSMRGEKWAVSGSKGGLFYDRSQQIVKEKFAVIVEGPTDTAGDAAKLARAPAEYASIPAGRTK